MVKVGFICEGATEQIFLHSDSFRKLLGSLNLESLPVIDAGGAGNLLPHNIGGYINRLENEGASMIVILTDLDQDVCITATKARVSPRPQDIVIIAVKKIEAWFLACSPALETLLGVPGLAFAEPEKDPEPYETINQLLVKHTGRGLAKRQPER
jgi:hypothetical protein